MKFRINRNKLYLLMVYFSMSFLYLRFVGGQQEPFTLIAFILVPVLMVVVSYEPLLRVIQQATGDSDTNNDLSFFSAFIDLNEKMHKFLKVDDVLILVNDTLKGKIKVRKVVFLLSTEFSPEPGMEADSSEDILPDEVGLRSWPNMSEKYNFLTHEFVKEIVAKGTVFAFDDASLISKKAFEETKTGLAIPIIQEQRILCIILIGRTDNAKRYTEFEYQMFAYLANQLSIILDRIRIYEKVMQKTDMDHAEKMQVMQSLSANIAHEMRTPLSGIRANISGLETYFPDLLKAYEYSVRNDPENFTVIHDNHMSTLQKTPGRIKLMIDQANTVIDMLLMNLRENSLDRKQLSICSVSGCIDQAMERYPFKTGDREKIDCDLNQEFKFLGVEILFIYIIFNLLKNSLYSLSSVQKGEISIRLERGKKFNTLYFKDTGEGIEQHVLGKIFDGFFTTKEDGTGAGLAFCKRTVLSLGGEIECSSVLGRYTEFKISLPVLDTVD